MLPHAFTQRCERLTEIVAKLARGLVLTLSQPHGGADLLAECLVGDRERDRLGDRRMANEYLVDLERGDLLSAPVDLLLQAAREKEVAVSVEDALVTGSEPTLGERGLVGARVVLVTVDDRRALDRDLAALTGRQ